MFNYCLDYFYFWFLVLQRDLGTSLLIFSLFVAMLYVATDRVSWIIIGLVLFTPAALIATKIFPHVTPDLTFGGMLSIMLYIIRIEGGSGQLVSRTVRFSQWQF